MAVNIENAYSNCQSQGMFFVSNTGEKLIDFDERTLGLKGQYHMVEAESKLGKSMKADCLIKKFPPDYSKLGAYSQLKNIKHPNVVSVENFYDKDGSPQFVLSWVDGTIRAWTKRDGAGKILKSTMRGSIPSTTYQKILIGACSALEELFEKKVYPARITAANLFLKNTCTGSGIPKILVSEVINVDRKDEARTESKLWRQLKNTAKQIFNSSKPGRVDPVALRFFNSFGKLTVMKLKLYPLQWDEEKKAKYLLRIMSLDSVVVRSALAAVFATDSADNKAVFWPGTTKSGKLPYPLHEMILYDGKRHHPSNYNQSDAYDYLRICKNLIKHWSSLPDYVKSQYQEVGRFVRRMDEWNPEIWCILYEKIQ